LLPPVLLHNMQPFRTTWSAWCELFTVFLPVWWYFDGQRQEHQGEDERPAGEKMLPGGCLQGTCHLENPQIIAS
ncbi:hypothetical protein H6B10_17565, partial [Gemmiger formicilis]|uniref:hypothetical protein n=1 Tax=Gemmiger formicilis TaxID=745368 RepID=UPI00195AB74C